MSYEVVDPWNPRGHVRLGYCFAGPGFWTSRAWRWGWTFSPQDRSKLISNSGGTLHARYRKPRRVARMNWNRRTPLSEWDRHLIDTTMIRTMEHRRDLTNLPHGLRDRQGVGMRADRPALLIDPSYGSTTFDAAVGGLRNGIYAAGTLFGRAELTPDLAEAFTDQWTWGGIRFTEDL